VEKAADTGVAAGTTMDADDTLYMKALEQNAINRQRPVDDVLDAIVQDDRIQWPDSMGVPPGGFLCVAASRIQRIPRFNYGGDERILP
jgi:hypothetical protein